MKKSENFPWSRTSNFYFDVKSVDVFESSANNDVTQFRLKFHRSDEGLTLETSTVANLRYQLS